MKLLDVKLVEDVTWPDCELHVITSYHSEDSKRLELIRRQVNEL